MPQGDNKVFELKKKQQEWKKKKGRTFYTKKQTKEFIAHSLQK